MSLHLRLIIPLLLLPIMTTQTLFAEELNEETLFTQLLKGSEIRLSQRYRLESVHQEGLSKNAIASTLRTRVSFRSDPQLPLNFLVEGENVSVLGGEQYNDLRNGRLEFPVVADPETTELNQALFNVRATANSIISMGREALKRGDERYIGDVGWRQNNQTMDGVNVTYQLNESIELFYGYVSQVNRVFGRAAVNGEWETDLHLFDIQYRPSPFLEFQPYVYLVEIEDAIELSTQTYGTEISGLLELNDSYKLHLSAEYAAQHDYAKNAISYSSDYIHINASLRATNFSMTFGYELLGSDNGYGTFTTPFATLHAWNGWADVFLGTPEQGLRDRYIKFSTNLIENERGVLMKLHIHFHDFSSDHGDERYGQEWNALITASLGPLFDLGLKYAYYDAQEFSVDTEKIMLFVDYKFMWSL